MTELAVHIVQYSGGNQISERIRDQVPAIQYGGSETQFLSSVPEGSNERPS